MMARARASRAAIVATAPARPFDAVIVGAGPTGLAAALALRARGARVALVEKASDPAAYDPERGFLYLIDGRGQAVLEPLGLMPALEAASVSQAAFRIAQVTDEPDGGVGEPVGLPIVNKNARGQITPQWVPRNTFVRLLDDAVAATRGAGGELPAIERLYGHELSSLHLQNATTWSVGAREAATGEEQRLTAQLVLGADGLRSVVRARLAELSNGRAFGVRTHRSAAAGLRYKVLTLPPSFQLSRRVPEARAEAQVAYSLRSTPGAEPSLRVGMLPLRSDANGRTANFITARHGHPLWEQLSAAEMGAYLRRVFPHVPLDAKHLGEEELARFAASRGGRFPAPTRCTHAALTVAGGACAALAGDALHAFPPDLGQGVNSGLQDVGALAEWLDAADVHFPAQSGPSLVPALAQYGAARAREATALCRMMTLGYPFQYSQQAAFGAVRRAFWALNFFVRLQLSRTLGARLGFHPQIFYLVQSPGLAYSEIVRRADVTTRALALLGALGAATLACAVRLAVRVVARLAVPGMPA